MRDPEWLRWPTEQVVAEARVPVRLVNAQDDVYQTMADDMLAELKANNAAGRPTRWIVPVGPIGEYPLLVEAINRERVDCSALHTFQMDEYLDWTGRPIPVEHGLSFTGHLERAFFSRIDPDLAPPREQRHAPDPRDLDALPRAIDAVGGVDTCWGGIGIHGHVAFNEAPDTRYGEITPQDMLQAPTRLVALQPETLVVNGIQGAGGNFENVPPFAVTIGLREICSAERIRLFAHRGRWQRTIFRRAVLQPPTVRYPVTLLQDHKDYLITIDERTARPPVAALV